MKKLAPLRRLAAAALISAQTLSFATVATVAHADVVITEEAKQHFAAGNNMLKDPAGPRYEEAYSEFKVAYASSPSWKLLAYLGLCAMELERDGEAIEHYEKYLTEGGASIAADEKTQVTTDLTTLKTSAVKVTIKVNQPGVMISDQRIPAKGGTINNSYGPDDASLDLRLHPGHHILTTKVYGYQPETWEFDAGSGSTTTHDFVLRPVAASTSTGTGASTGTGTGKGDGEMTLPIPEKPSRKVPDGVYITASITGVLLVGGVVVGVLAKGKKSDFDTKNDGTDPTAAKNLKDQGQKLNLFADVMFGGAVVAAAVTTVLYFTRPDAKDTARARFAPAWTPGGGVLTLSGAF